MKVLSLSHSYSLGGAARAAARINASISAQGIGLTEWSLDQEPRTTSPFDFSTRAALWEHRAWKIDPSSRYRSTGLYGHFSAQQISEQQFDAVILHWVARGVISLHQLNRLKLPIVWVLHDLWPVSFLSHYDGVSVRNSGQLGRKLVSISIGKTRVLSRSHLVAPSDWVVEKIREKGVAAKSVTPIPYPLSASQFTQIPKDVARAALGLPNSTPLVGFADLSGVSDPRKGWKVLSRAMTEYAANGGVALLVVAGIEQKGFVDLPDFVGAYSVGRLRTPNDLSRFYSAMDVVAVPSTEDVVNQVATEAQICGTPVIAFRATGVGATLEASPSAFLVNELSVDSFSRALEKSLVTISNNEGLNGERIRGWATREWSPLSVGAKYRELFAKIV